MYWIYNEEKPVVAERFIRTLKTKICKQMTSDSMELHYSKEVNDPKFKVGDHVRFSKYKYWSEEVFVQFRGHMLLMI